MVREEAGGLQVPQKNLFGVEAGRAIANGPRTTRRPIEAVALVERVIQAESVVSGRAIAVRTELPDL